MGRCRNVTNEEVARLYQSGLSVRLVAAQLGLAFGTVQNRLRKHGVALRPTGSPRALEDKTRATIAEMYTMLEMSTREIAREIGVSQFAVWKSLRRSGIPRRPDAEARVLARWQGKSKYAPPAPCGSRHRASDGYVWVKLPEHPHATQSGWVREHIVVWVALHGPLPNGWVVHHLNGVRDDNRLENLQVMSRAEHRRHHAAEREIHKSPVALARQLAPTEV